MVRSIARSLVVAGALLLSGCGGSSTAGFASTAEGTPSSVTDAISSNAVTSQGMPEGEGNDMERTMTMTIGRYDFTIALEENAVAKELLARLPLTIDMNELNGNEKYHYFETGFTAEPERVGTIQAGDLMLYGKDCLVLFYESFATPYSYTRIGRVEDVSNLKEAVGEDGVTVSFRR